MIVPQDKKADFTVEEKDNLIALHTDSLQVTVDKTTGEVVFMNKNGEIILQENAGGGKSFHLNKWKGQKVTPSARFLNRLMMRRFTDLDSISLTNSTTKAKTNHCFSTTPKFPFHS